MAQVRSRENTFKVDLSNFPKRPSIEELQKFVLVNLGLTVDQVRRFQVNHAQNCVHVKCSSLKLAQDTVAKHDGKHVLEMNKTKVTVRLVMEDGGVEVKIHDLSENVTNDDIVAFLRHYGDVLSIREMTWGESFPLRGMSSGIRVAKMILRRHIKSFATIQGENTLISYRGQPTTCRHCTLTQHIGISCVENKKLLGQKSDLSSRLKNASVSTSYASMLIGDAPATNTLLPQFTGLGSGIPKRPTAIVPESTVPNASLDEAAASSTGHSAVRSMIVSGDGISSTPMNTSTNVAERSVGLEVSGGGSTSTDQSTLLPNATALTADAHIESSMRESRYSAEQVASGDNMPSPPSPSADQAADGIKANEAMETEQTESENPVAAAAVAAVSAVAAVVAEDVADLNSQQPQSSSSLENSPVINEDAEMSSSPGNASSGNFKFPLPVPDPKNARSLSSISGSESDISEDAGFTKVEKKRPGRPKKPRNK